MNEGKRFVSLALFLSLSALCAPGLRAQKVGGRAVNDLRQVDFRNFTYQPDCAYNKESLRTSGGSYSRESGDDKIFFDVRKIVYGDLTGDGKDEAVVLTNCNTGGTGQFSEAFIYTLRGGAAALLTKFLGGDRAFGGIHDARVAHNLLTMETYAPEQEGVGACCPEYIVTTNYRWNGRKLVEVGKPGKRKYTPEP